MWGNARLTGATKILLHKERTIWIWLQDIWQVGGMQPGMHYALHNLPLKLASSKWTKIQTPKDVGTGLLGRNLSRSLFLATIAEWVQKNLAQAIQEHEFMGLKTLPRAVNKHAWRTGMGSRSLHPPPARAEHLKWLVTIYPLTCQWPTRLTRKADVFKKQKW